MSDCFRILLLDGVVFVAWKIQRWELEDGGSDSKCRNCCLPSCTTSARLQTFALQDGLPLSILLVILLKGSLSFSLLSPITRDPLLLSTHHYGSGCKDGSEENLSYQTVKRLIRLGSWMQPPRKLPTYMTSLVLWRHKFYLGVSLLSSI